MAKKMTSKELNEILNKTRRTKDISLSVEQIEELVKDLEVLEQLKEILSMDYLVRVYGYEMAKRLQTYLKSNDIVKEWLENDK